MSITPTPEPDPDIPAAWAILPSVNLVLESNYGGQRVDVCARCGAVVLWELKGQHDRSHMTSLLGMGF